MRAPDRRPHPHGGATRESTGGMRARGNTVRSMEPVAGPARRQALSFLRYGVPAILFVIGWLILFLYDGAGRWEGWAMCLGSAGSLLLLNVLFRFGAKGDEDRAHEEAAREFLREHGHWPDEDPPKR